MKSENENPGVHASPPKVCDENKELKNDCYIKIFNERRTL